jgi:hypothetical protein
MTIDEAIREETRRYLSVCTVVGLLRQANNLPDACRAKHLAHIHLLALGRLRGQTVAPWIHQNDCAPTGGVR